MPRRQSAVEAMARLVESTDFVRVLHSPSRARTPHFAVHYLPPAPGTSSAAWLRPLEPELSTMTADNGSRPVDDCSQAVPPKRLGAVVPKRLARRAVTRSLLKRQIYAAGDRHVGGLGLGLWIVRLHAPFDRILFPSAASTALRLAARTELESLFRAATRAQMS